MKHCPNCACKSTNIEETDGCGYCKDCGVVWYPPRTTTTANTYQKIVLNSVANIDTDWFYL